MFQSFYRYILVCSLILLTACGLTMPTYQGNGFSIKYPSGWSVSTADQTKLVTISCANPTTYSVDGVIVVQGEPLGNNDAVGVVAANEAALRANNNNQNFQTDKVTIAGQSTALWKYEQVSGSQKTSFRQAMVVIGGTIYTITGTANQNVQNIGDVETAVESFSLNK